VTLLVDVGNSAIKWALLQSNGDPLHPGQQVHRGVDDVSSQLIEQWRSVPPQTPVIGCNVASASAVTAVEAAAQTLRFGHVSWLKTQARFEGLFTLVNGYRDPTQLGSDRWHAMLGACSLALEPAESVVVVNAGTATTVDCIEIDDTKSQQGSVVFRFIGGVIAPGIRLMLEALARETAGLPAAQGAPADFPDNTDAAIVTGVLDSQAGLVHRVWHRFAVGLSDRPRLVITGGNAARLLSRLSIEGAAIEDNLVLRGAGLRARTVISTRSVAQ